MYSPATKEFQIQVGSKLHTLVDPHPNKRVWLCNKIVVTNTHERTQADIMNRKIVIMVSKSYVYALATHMQTKMENMAHADSMLSI